MTTDRCEAVRRAAAVTKDLRKLRDLLGVPISVLRAWLQGRGNPPVHTFLKAVDIIDSDASARQR